MGQLTAKERVEQELKELNEKTDKLSRFIFSVRFEELDDLSKSLLQVQHTTMLSYSYILKCRLDNWKD